MKTALNTPSSPPVAAAMPKSTTMWSPRPVAPAIRQVTYMLKAAMAGNEISMSPEIRMTSTPRASRPSVTLLLSRSKTLARDQNAGFFIPIATHSSTTRTNRTNSCVWISFLILSSRLKRGQTARDGLCVAIRAGEFINESTLMHDQDSVAVAGQFGQIVGNDQDAHPARGQFA
jgi:hypothetical protein